MVKTTIHCGDPNRGVTMKSFGVALCHVNVDGVTVVEFPRDENRSGNGDITVVVLDIAIL